MGIEKMCYRDMILILNERFPDHVMLSQKEVAAVAGITRQTAERRYGVGRGHKISICDLARKMCE